MNRPTGTVTLLFTDIEGSTKRWESNAPAMRSVLAQHDAVMRKAIADRNGHVFKTIGDAFCAVFQRTEDAIEACLDAQRGLRKIDVPEMGPVRVRMALHSGEAEQRDGDYFGTAVNRISKFLSIGHGEQVLLTSPTRDAVHLSLPTEAQLRDMGEHRLKDIPEPEHVYQLVHPDLRTDFPALKSVDSQPNNLPTQLSSFVGRENELKQLCALIHTTSLLTLTGSGGSGKTRLALRVGESVLHQFPDGVWMVELAPISDATQIPFAVLRALGLQEQASKRIEDVLIGHLSGKSALLVLDNCEHILNACSTLVAEMLGHCPNLSMIATSREPLGVEGEISFVVPPLSIPAGSGVATGDLMKYDSIALFVERVRTANPELPLDDTAATCAAEICRLLDGIPLALELAAALTRKFSLEQVRIDVVGRFQLLTEQVDTAVRRHQTLHNAIEWSYQLLTDDEKRLFRALSIFAGGWTLESLAAVCAGEDRDEYVLFELLTQLAAKSLVVVSEEDAAEPRYRFLEAIRQFASNKAIAAAELESFRSRHADYFLSLVESSNPQAVIGETAARLFDRFEVEHQNLLAAIEWWRTSPATIVKALRLASGVSPFWGLRGYRTVGMAVLGELIPLAESSGAVDADPKLFARALNSGGNLATTLARYEEAEELFSRSLSILQGLNDSARAAAVLGNLGVIARYREDFATARARYQQSLEIRREIGDQNGIAIALTNLATVAWLRGDYAAAQAACQEALSIVRRIGNHQVQAQSLLTLAILSRFLGNHVKARSHCQDSLRVSQDIGDKGCMATSLCVLGDVERDAGEIEAAQTLYQQALALGRESGDPVCVAEMLNRLGTIAHDRGDDTAAARLFEESLRMRSELANRLGIAESLEQVSRLVLRDGSPESASLALSLMGAVTAMRDLVGAVTPPPELANHNQSLAHLRAALGDERFDSTFAAGKALVHGGKGCDRATEQALAWLGRRLGQGLNGVAS